VLDGPGFYSWQGQETFFFSGKSTQALVLTHSPTELIPGVLSPGVKRPRGEAGHSPVSTADIKNKWIYSSTNFVCFHGLKKKRSRLITALFWVITQRVVAIPC